jgi:YD repeat-containing protein
MEDTTGVTSSTFDPLDRRQSVVTPAGKAVTYAYDEVGLRASMMAPNGGVFTHAYTSENQLSSLVNPQGRIRLESIVTSVAGELVQCSIGCE